MFYILKLYNFVFNIYKFYQNSIVIPGKLIIQKIQPKISIWRNVEKF